MKSRHGRRDSENRESLPPAVGQLCDTVEGVSVAVDSHLLRNQSSDAPLVALAALHAAVLWFYPTMATVALGLWWNSNTVSHNFIHRPFFCRRGGNTLFSGFLTLILGFPQELWRQRHLAHHREQRPRLLFNRQLVVELALVAALWGALAASAPGFLVMVYLPGFLLGQALCALHGYYEHAAETTSHYGRCYNWLFFNDGYHVEHHAHPAVSWRELPALALRDARVSRWPAILRWLDGAVLDALERFVLRSGFLQAFVLRTHERAFRRLLPGCGLRPNARVAIIGGGIFPRTALVLAKLLPGAELVIIDRDAASVASARRFVDARVRFVTAWFEGVDHGDYDAVVVPLAHRGDRRRFYAAPPARVVFVHDWIWNARGHSAIISWLLFKRLNVVVRVAESDSSPSLC